MTMKVIVFYLAFIGTFLSGILSVLWIGSHLVAPPAVSGVWTMDIDAQSLENMICQTTPIWTDSPSFTIGQSGKYLDIVFNDSEQTSLSGILDGMTITAQSSSSRRRADSLPATGQPTSLEATLERSESTNQLVGTIELAGCAGALPFVATSQPLAASETGGGAE
jgi:hypothetical protein